MKEEIPKIIQIVNTDKVKLNLGDISVPKLQIGIKSKEQGSLRDVSAFITQEENTYEESDTTPTNKLNKNLKTQKSFDNQKVNDDSEGRLIKHASGVEVTLDTFKLNLLKCKKPEKKKE